MKSNELAALTRPLIGQQLKSVEQLDYTWFFKFTGDITVATESLWRLLNGGRIIVTSEDHGHQFGLREPVDAAQVVRASVVGRPVEAATISPSSGDLTIEFGGRAQIELLQVSGGYESWRLSANGSEIICTGGGNIARFPKS